MHAEAQWEKVMDNQLDDPLPNILEHLPGTEADLCCNTVASYIFTTSYESAEQVSMT